MDLQSLPVGQRIGLLLKALDGAQRTNEALARCSDGEAMLEVLLDASRKLGLGLSRQDLKTTPPIRDWMVEEQGGPAHHRRQQAPLPAGRQPAGPQPGEGRQPGQSRSPG